MLAHLNFTNFKSWSRLDMPCGRITGIFGTNSSGKSSILQFLLLLKQTREATDRATALELNGDYVKLGTIKDAIHRHDVSSSMYWRVEFELDENIELSDSDDPKRQLVARGTRLSVASGVTVEQMAPRAAKLEYQVGAARFELAPKDGDPTRFELKAAGKTAFNFIRTKGRPPELRAPIKSYAFPDQARASFQNADFLADLETAYEKAFDSIFYLGPLREFPQRDYLYARSRPTDVGRRGEKAIDAILAATHAGEMRRLKKRGRAKSLPFQGMIAHWLAELGLVAEFRVDEIAPDSNRWQAILKTRKGGEDVLLTDVGFGVSQVLPVITLLQYVPEGSTVLVEQPEIHLHPLAQAALADVIIHAARERRVQVILESHSEHLLLRLQRRIAEASISSDDVKLYFCDAPNGASQLVPLELDPFGRIQNWPEKFMGDAFGETAEAEIAGLRRAAAVA